LQVLKSTTTTTLESYLADIDKKPSRSAEEEFIFLVFLILREAQVVVVEDVEQFSKNFFIESRKQNSPEGI
jgi:hypothetical protein